MLDQLGDALQIQIVPDVKRNPTDQRTFPHTEITFQGGGVLLRFRHGQQAATGKEVGAVEFTAAEVPGDGFDVVVDRVDARIKLVSTSGAGVTMGIKSPEGGRVLPPEAYQEKPEKLVREDQLVDGSFHGAIVFFGGTRGRDEDGFPQDGVAVSIYRMDQVVYVEEIEVGTAKRELGGGLAPDRRVEIQLGSEDRWGKGWRVVGREPLVQNSKVLLQQASGRRPMLEREIKMVRVLPREEAK